MNDNKDEIERQTVIEVRKLDENAGKTDESPEKPPPIRKVTHQKSNPFPPAKELGASEHQKEMEEEQKDQMTVRKTSTKNVDKNEQEGEFEYFSSQNYINSLCENYSTILI